MEEEKKIKEIKTGKNVFEISWKQVLKKNV